MNETASANIAAIFTPFIAPVISALASWVMAELVRFLRSKTKNETLGAALDQISETATAAVQSLEVEFTRAMADGKLTKEEALQIKEMALDRVKENLPAWVQKAARMSEGALYDYISGKIEEANLLTKRMKTAPDFF